MKFKTLIIIILIYTTGYGSLTYSQNYEKNTNLEYEEAIITLSANNSISEKEILAFIGKNEVFISLDDFMSSIGILEYELKGEKINYHINGKSISKEIKTVLLSEIVTIEISEIKKLIDTKVVKWDFYNLNLNLKTSEMLPKEYLIDKQNARENLSKIREKETVVEEEWKMFTPGILSLGYSKYDIKKSPYNLYLDYNNHLFYGNFNTDISYTYDDSNNKVELNRVSWERNILDERLVTVGDTYLRNNFNIGKSSSLVGVSVLRKKSWDTTMDVSNKNIRGIASTGSIVELYENGILRDYVIAKKGEYIFPIETTGGNRTYEVWIYSSNGSIEKKKVSLYGDSKLVEVGEIDYEIQLGQDDKVDEELYNANFYYGLTEDLTIGIGGSNVLSTNYKSNSKKNDYLNTSLLQRFATKGKWSSIISGDFSFNSKDVDESHYKVEGKASSSKVTNVIGIENYKKLDLDFLTENYDEKFYLKSDFSLFNKNISLSYEKEEEKKRSTNLDRYGISMYGTLIRGKLSTSMDYSYEKKHTGGSKSHKDRIGVLLSYSLSNPQRRRFLETISLNYQFSESNENSYGVRLYKNKGNKSFDYSIGYKKVGNESSVELSLSYTFGNKFELRSRTINRGGKTTTSFGGNTNINFGMNQKLRESSTSGKSNVKGIVYIDENADGTFNRGEEKVENISVINSGSEGLSNREGYYEVPLITSKYKQELRIVNKNEDLVGGYIFPEKYFIKTLPGGILNIDIPISKVKTLVGMFEFSNDFYLEDVNDFLKNTKIDILNLKTKKSITLEILSESIIEEVPQGKYLLSVEYSSNRNILKSKEFLIDLSGKDLEAYLDFQIDQREEGVYILNLKLNDEKVISEI